MGFAKRPTNDTLTAAAGAIAHSNSLRSFQDLFATQNSEQAKGMIMTGVRHEIHRNQGRVASESGSEDYIVNKIDPTDLSATPTIVRMDRTKRKPTMLLTGPKFRFHTVKPEVNLKRDTIYPIAVNDFFCS